MPGISDRQRLFCREYLKDFNATQAATRAGYSKKSARIQGCQLLTNPNIQTELARLATEIVKKNDITPDKVVNELARLAFLDPADFFDDDQNLLSIKDMPEHARRAIAGIEIDAVKMKNSVGEEKITTRTSKVKITRKEKALELLGRYLKLFEDDKAREITLTIIDMTGHKS